MSRSMFRSNASLFHRVLAVSALGLGVLAAGCGSTPDNTATAAADKAAAAPQAEQHTGVGAPFLREASSLTDLRPDQKQAIDGIRATLQQQGAPVREARAQLGAELAQEVRAGKIDEARVQPLVDRIAAAATGARPAVQQAMNTLHDTLSASQRQALVDATAASAGDHRGKGMMKERMEKLADELGLTDAQREAIRAQLHAARGEHRGEGRGEHARGGGHMRAMAAAFVSDDFDAKTLDVGAHHGMAQHFSKRMIRVLEAAVPVLDAKQREALASKIESRAQIVDEE